MIQGTEEWFTARLGKITSSRVADMMAKTKSGPSASRKNYMMELLCQRLTGQREPSFTSPAMQRGTELEPLARSAYEVETGWAVIESGFIVSRHYEFTGTSPDGMVGDLGLVEIKCPNTAQHVAVIRAKSYDKKYYPQMQHQMYVTQREWCDFVSFDDRMPEPLQLHVSRVERDNDYIDQLIDEMLAFNSELEALELEMLELISV